MNIIKLIVVTNNSSVAHCFGLETHLVHAIKNSQETAREHFEHVQRLALVDHKLTVFGMQTQKAVFLIDLVSIHLKNNVRA